MLAPKGPGLSAELGDHQ